MFTITGFSRETKEAIVHYDDTSEVWPVAVQCAGDAQPGDFQFVAAFESSRALAMLGTWENMPPRGRPGFSIPRGAPARSFTVVGFNNAAESSDVRFPTLGRVWVEAAWEVFDYFNAIEDVGASDIYQFVGVFDGRAELVGDWQSFVKITNAAIDDGAQLQRSDRRAAF